MKYYSKKQWTQKLTVMVFLAMALGGTAVQAMPSGADIRSGQGSISQDGKNMTVQQNSQRMAIDWTKFDIAKDETVRYAQPDRNAISLNRVTGGQQSVIAGNLNADGNVVLVNPNGVVFTKNSSVDVGGLVASTARLNDEAMKNFSNGKDRLGLSLDKDSTASVINEGQIKAQGGLVALHAANVENKGTITNEGGTIALAAAKNLTLSAADDDKLNFTVDGELAKSQALNSGSLKADGGYVVMTAKSAGDVLSTVVNNTGTIEAKTLRKNEKGQILLDGGESGQVEVSGTLDASGTDKGQDSGNIKVIGQKTIVHDNTNLLAKGDINGGKIETSGDVLDLGDNLAIDAAGVNGKHGEWLLDPLEVIISDSQLTYDDYTTSTGGTLTGDTSGKGTIKNNVIYNDPAGATANAGSTNSSTTWINVDTVKSVLNKGTDITIQAISSTGAASITLDSPINVNIDKNASKNPTFTLEATRNITINSQITADSFGKGLNVILNADTDGDAIGAVIINADISTNGGNFISATGGTVTHKSQSNTPGYNKYSGSSINFKTPVEISGAPNHSGSTVGTYFGDANSATAARNRHISTNGGAITLNGEVAIGLNGGTLNLETNGGALTVTGIVNSGNSYDYYYYDADTDTWNKTSDDAVIKKINGYVDKVLNGTEGVPMYEYKGINYSKDKDGNLTWTYDAVYYPDATNGNAPHYVFRPLSKAEADDAGQFITNNTNNNRDKEDTTNFSHTLTTSNPKWYLTKKAGWGFNSFIVTGKSSMTIDAFLTYLKNTYGNKANFNSRYPHGTTYSAFTDAEKENLRKDITSYLAHNWYVAQEMASTGSKGNGDQVGDSYLATITTRLENSLTTPNGAHIMWAGGRGSGVRNRNTKNDANNVVTWYPADPTHPDGFYWVTGPEGLSTDNQSNYNDTPIGTGTKFWDTSSTDVQKDSNNYGQSVFGEAHWSTNLVGHQPDDNGPFLTVGYGSDNQWDDANFGGETTVGFVRETNLANSSLKINTGSGAVNLQGNIGGSQKLDTVTVNTTGNVTTGGSKVTDYNMGTIHADHGVTINGGNVTIGGRISSGASTETVNTDTSAVTDNVTITAAGTLTVHGITANGKTDAHGNVTKGGKIKLTSTANDGIIKLESTDNSNKIDYTDEQKNKHEGDKEKDNGTLIAASSEKGAVVVDAQGTKGAFVNKTTGTKGIDTAGTWLIYSASPDKDNFGTNLNSKNDAEWTAKSNDNANDTNNSGKTMHVYGTTDSTHTINKYIFQTTPTITLYVEDHEKTYGDDITNELQRYLKSREEFTGVDGTLHNVNEFTDAFQEKPYTNYISVPEGQSITVTSVGKDGADGAVGTATRTGGKYEATDKQKAIYDLNVNLNGAEALDGYALNKENAKLEIKRKTLTINTNISQTYGNDTPTLVTPSDYQNQLVGKDTLSTDDITYTISSTGKYAPSKGTSGTTAHVGTYAGEYLTTGAKVKDGNGNDASANYEVSGSGTITVNKADLYLKVGDVSTTYGTAFDDTQYGYTVDSAKGGLVNGDTQSVLGDQFLNYTNTGAKTDASNDKVKTQNAGTYYELQGAASKALSDYTVHITNGKSTVKKATLTVNPEDIHQIYGQAAEVQEDAKTAYNLSGFANGDTKDTVDATNKDGKTIDQLVTVTNDVSKALKDENTHTQNASTDGYEMVTTATGDLTNYNIVIGDSKKVYLDKAELVIDTAGGTKNYGDVAGVQADLDKAASFHVKGSGETTVNGDDEKNIRENLKIAVGSNALQDNGTRTNDVKDGGYDIIVTDYAKELQNYKVETGTVGKEKLNRVDLYVDSNNLTKSYGDSQGVLDGLDSKERNTLTGLVNGDDKKEDSIRTDIGIKNNSPAVYTKDGKSYTKDVGDYEIQTALTHQTITNYNVKTRNAGKVTLTPVAITVDNEMIQTYGSKDRSFKEVVDPGLVNGDKISTDGLKMAPKAGGKYETSKGNRTTADAGIYKDDLTFSGGGIVHADGTTDASKNYKVTIKGDIIVNKAPLYVNTDDILTYYGVVKNTQSRVTGLTNGDQADGIQYGYGDYGHGYLNGNTTTNMPGNYAFGTSLSGPDFLKNYNIIGGNANLQIIQSKPDQTTHYVEGAHRPQDKLESALPVFRVDASGVVKQYGTYGIESQSQAVTLSPTGMRMPEPNQTSTQDRKYLTTLKTAHGHGTFRLEYNGVVLRVIPVDPAAEQIVTDGDKMKNVALSEQALHAAYTQMGLDLVNLKGVYIYMAPM